MKKKFIVKYILTLFLITGILLPAHAQKDKRLADKAVTQGLIKSHIGFLASDELKGRDTPSEGQTIAARYIENQFIRYGVKKAPGMQSYMQDVFFKSTKAPGAGTLSLGESTFNLKEDFILIQGGKPTLSAEYVFVNHGTEADLKAQDISGKIVVAVCGDGVSEQPQEWFSYAAEKRKNVSARGGVALVELYQSAQIPWNFLVRFFSRDIISLDDPEEPSASLPHIWLKRSSRDFTGGQIQARLDIVGAETTAFTAPNVVGFVEGTDKKLKDEIVVFSAHYDHVGIGQADTRGDSIYNGARDNAVGTSTVLIAAQNIARKPTKRSALFILFTAEEKGLLGSRWFVNHAPVDLQDIVYCFNSDNGGYNDVSKATIIGLTRTTAEEMITRACNAFGLQAIEDPVPEQGLFDRSDNVEFAKKGIPAPMFSMGLTAFDEEITQYYHQPLDQPNTLDYDYLVKFFKSYVYASRMIANAKKPPFWVEGDKYYDAGMALYKQ